MRVTADMLRRLVRSKQTPRFAKEIANGMNKYSAEYGVSDVRSTAIILANIAVETGGFRKLTERLKLFSWWIEKDIWTASYICSRLQSVWAQRQP